MQVKVTDVMRFAHVGIGHARKLIASFHGPGSGSIHTISQQAGELKDGPRPVGDGGMAGCTRCILQIRWRLWIGCIPRC